MTKNEIKDAAKGLILNHGPAPVLELGEEIFQSHTPPDCDEWTHREAILAEARVQAHRVYRFLGYVSPLP